MTKFQRFVSLIILLPIVLWERQAGTPPAFYPQNQPRQESSSLPLEFTAAIYSNKTKEPLNGLGLADFRLHEDGSEQRITAVELDSKPLSVMLVMTLGVTGDCGFLDLSQFTTWLSGALRKSLNPGEEVGIMVTDREGKILLEFGEIEKPLRWALGATDAEDSDYWEARGGDKPWLDFDSGKVGEVTTLSTLKVFGEVTDPNSDDNRSFRSAISVNPQNYIRLVAMFEINNLT